MGGNAQKEAPWIGRRGLPPKAGPWEAHPWPFLWFIYCLHTTSVPDLQSFSLSRTALTPEASLALPQQVCPALPGCPWSRPAPTSMSQLPPPDCWPLRRALRCSFSSSAPTLRSPALPLPAAPPLRCDSRKGEETPAAPLRLTTRGVHDHPASL